MGSQDLVKGKRRRLSLMIVDDYFKNEKRIRNKETIEIFRNTN